MKNRLFVIAAVFFFGVVSNANALTFDSSNLGAQAIFTVSGTDLLVTLTNTSTGDPIVPTDILTGVVFSIPDNPLLTRESATLASGSTVLRDDQPSGGIVGGEWAYTNNLLGTSYAGQSAIYSSGYFDGNALFPGSNLEGPVSVNGVGYGLTSMNDTPGNDNGGISSVPLIQNSVDFVLSGLEGGFDVNSISGVSFLYGTDLSENVPPPVPEPATLMLLGFGLSGLAFYRRRIFKS